MITLVTNLWILPLKEDSVLFAQPKRTTEKTGGPPKVYLPRKKGCELSEICFLHTGLAGGTLPSCDNGERCALNVVIKMKMRYLSGPWLLPIVIMVRTVRYRYLVMLDLLRTLMSRLECLQSLIV